ncbi:MAG TPA: TonB-dependent receptor, partial [Fimbriimonadaceae bacterium]|nr:TonB-dependent receptor [Fimbriimonadaceae bacterium]
DPTTHKPVAGLVDVYMGSAFAFTVAGTATSPTPWIPIAGRSKTLRVIVGTALHLQDGPPERDITIIVRASRIAKPAPPPGASGKQIEKAQLDKFTNTAANDSKALVRGQSGVAEDSAGQAHIRGEHAQISYVVDGVPLPDTLAGRQGSVIVPSTIQRYDILTGGFAPEFGGQTAAILDITTLPGARRFTAEGALQGGSFDTYNGLFTAQGPLGPRLSYVVNVGATTTRSAEEPHQPDVQDAHNAGASQSIFANFKAKPSARESLALTLSRNPETLQISNRTGLPASFASVGQGYGFLGLRNADGTRPDATDPSQLGAAPALLPNQQGAGNDINQDEVSEFAVLDYHRSLGRDVVGQFAVTLLHAGSSLWNNNPAVDVTNLPADSSIEYNPTVTRNVHHTQFNGTLEVRRGRHDLKFGGLYDAESGQESYQIIPASQLALDELFALDPALAPPGAMTGQQDIDGKGVFKATGPTPTLSVRRSGFYGAAFAQDTWMLGRLTLNLGVRADWYRQTESIGSTTVSTFDLSPRLNLAYKINRTTDARASADRLVNNPPLAQGAIVGAPIQPEKLNQYDLGVNHRLGHGQAVSAAYYYKDIRNQVDTGLLVPGVDVGLYSAVNFQVGAVHGLEFSYDLTPPKGVGWDGYVNYSYSTAAPNGLDNTGAPVPTFNDHDQRHSLGSGLAYTWRSGAAVATTLEYGSGLTSSVVYPDGPRIPRYQVDLHLTTGRTLLNRHFALTLDVQNLTDQRTVINFQSGFSGTRFMQGRRLLIGIEGKL